MDLIGRRRELLLMQHEPDTSPRIEAYNKRLRGGLRVEDYNGLCITDWINVEPQLNRSTTLVFPDIYPDTYMSMYQYVYSDDTSDWSYYPSMGMTAGSAKIIVKVRFTIPMDKLATCYAYNEWSGQIFFAAMGSIYYGHRNISELA